MRRFVRDNSLSLFFLALFVLALLGQSIAGYNVYSHEQLEHDQPTISYLRFLVTSDFGANVLENWQSEWLQFWWGTYVTSSDFWERSLQNWQSEFLAVGTMAVFTVYLRQRRSPESKPVGAPHTETGSSG